MADYDLLLSDEWDPSGATTWGEDGTAPPSCDCPTAPRQFLIPPPPPPPAMGVCGGSTFGDRSAGGYFCHLEPMGAEFTQAGFPSLPVIAVCSSVVLVAFLVASFLLWRHKTKVQNLLPCKHEQPGHCDHAGANGVTYEDVLINHHPTRLPITTSPMVGGQTLMPIELLDVKLGDMGPPDSPTLHPGSYYPSGGRVLGGKPFHHPVYEEISREPSAVSKSVSKSYDSDVEESGRGGRSFTTTSEDDFAEDELSGLEYPSGEGSRHCSATSSVQGSTGGDLCRDPVSSDEGGATEELDYQGGLLPENTFDYPSGKHLNIPHRHPHHDGHIDRIPPNLSPGQAKFLQNAMPTPIFTNHSRPEDCANTPQLLLPPIRVGYGGKMHTPHHPNSNLNSNNKWAVCPPPAVASPVENIYSTIDEGEDSVDDMVSLSSVGYPASRGPLTRANVPKAKQLPDHRIAPPPSTAKQLSQRNTEEESESYGDLMPAYGSTACT